MGTRAVPNESPAETCGFALHLLTALFAVLYILWLAVPPTSLMEWNIDYYPPKSLGLLFPTSLVLAFLGAPFLYAAANLASTPRIDSISSIWDEHSRIPTSSGGTTRCVCLVLD
mmetsp:Transcript_4482/g.7766  ORF Transcript_4482/g.7766 Transcript_4482/m.7766 type:complete len:114 (-) Transcript_4482:117-458(-)